MTKITISILFVTILFTNCNMKPKQIEINKEEYFDLSQFNDFESYTVDSIFDSNYKISEVLFDSIQNILSVVGSDKKVKKYHRRKIDIAGNVIDQGQIFTTLKDGTMWYTDCYSNWLINSDTTHHKYIDPLTAEEKRNPEKWLIKFDKLYKEASYVHVYLSDYYFKVNDKWYLIEANYKAHSLGLELNKQFPAKENDARMIELKDQCPSFGIAPEKRDTSLMKEMKYESTFFEKSSRGKAFNFSAGWWYLDMYLPGGYTLKIKRYASYRNPALKIYKIPKEHGGRDDVLFIVQEPSEMLKEQVGGMYVIRPKNIK